jgi:hypothetical protein
MIPEFFGKPPQLYESPRCLGMSHANARLYDFLFWVSHRRSSLQFDVLDEEITKLTDLSPRTLATARKDLSKRGLIVCRRQTRGYTYVICDPKTGEPYSGEPKVQIRKERKNTPEKQPDAAPQKTRVEPTKPTTQTTLHVLPVRPDGRPDYGFDKIFGAS